MYTAVNNIYEHLYALRTTTLSYVKQWGKGSPNTFKWQYPFVTVGTVNFTMPGITIGEYGSDLTVFRVKLWFGDKGMVPEAAFFGDANTRGVLRMADDLRAICRANTFNQAFTFGAIVEEGNTQIYSSESSDWIFVGELTITGRRKEKRQR